MFWQKKKDVEFDQVDRVIRENPGIRPSQVAHELGVPRSTVTRRLASMGEAGYLYYEEDDGTLWPFDSKA